MALLPSTTPTTSTDPTAAIDQLFDEVSQTFWMIFFFYIVVSIAWIMYCCITSRMELEFVEKKIVANGVARTQELQRLLDAYNRIEHSSIENV